MLTFLFVLGLWCVDIGISGLLAEEAGYKAEVYTFFGIRTPNQQYHIGLWTAEMAWIILSLMCLNEITTKNKKDSS